MKPSFCAVLTAVLLCVSSGEGAPSATLKTLVLIMAHPDDESPVAPILSRYAREGVQVHLIIATDGAQGAVVGSDEEGTLVALVGIASNRGRRFG